MASQYRFTVTEILTLISDLKGESSVNSDTIRIRAVDRAHKDFAGRKLWDLFLLTNQTTVGAGTNAVTLGSASFPARPKGLTEVFVATTGSGSMTPESSRCEIVSSDEFKNRFNADNSKKLVYQYFDASANEWKMYVSPAPAATETVTHSYYWTPATVSAVGDFVYCYDPMILARLANAYLFETEDDDKYQDQLQLAENLIAKWESQVDEFSAGQTKAMGSPYGGIGGY